jgi:hypothetical protein
LRTLHAADPLDAAVGLVDDLGQVGEVRLASSTALKLDHSPSTGLRSGVVLVGHAFVQNLRRGHCELAVEEPANRRLTVAFDELALVV